ncbi:sugar kinase [Clostridium sp. C8-1-8]|uniref:sugar kinase n=1 Tax=Clostridium sp. C8-1-8 TaxID=2698831 RepID=UPI00136A0ACB|nr:sugar kinase [Clostridium sp. C8-1-8]
MAKVVTLGELLLRLSPPGNGRFLQASQFDLHFGGSEANVALSLALFGHQSVFISKIPSNPIGDSGIQILKKQGVDCSKIARGGERLGIYYLENGYSVRPSRVVYDRSHSAITEAEVSEFDFDKIFDQADLFHVSGITPVLSEKAAILTMAAMKAAKKKNITVSFDLNYRLKLWTTDVKEKQKIMQSLMEYTDICFGNALDAAKCMGYSGDGIDYINSSYELSVSAEEMAKVVKNYGLKYLITSLRNSISASDNGYSAAISDGTTYYKGKEYDLHILDRVGGGDAFTAGFLHGYLTGKSMEEALEFGIAAAAIKHTLPGDINYTTVDEVEALVATGGSGRVIR